MTDRHPLLEKFPVVRKSELSWGDMDVYGVVNNCHYFRYFEDTRVEYFKAMDLPLDPEGQDLAIVVAKSMAKYKIPLRYPDTIWVGARITGLDDGSFTMEHKLVSKTHDKIAAEGSVLCAIVNIKEESRAYLPDDILARIRELEGNPKL